MIVPGRMDVQSKKLVASKKSSASAAGVKSGRVSGLLYPCVAVSVK